MRVPRILLAFLLLLTTAWVQADQEQRVDHVVLVWFKPDTPAEFIEELRRQTLTLATIPGIQDLHLGSALTSDRPIVDDSFHLGITMRFASAQAMRDYLVHERHKAFVENYVKGRVEKLLVYDIAAYP